MHVGHNNMIDIDYTIKRRRTIDEGLEQLPDDAPERKFFESDVNLHRAFPNRSFHCWGVPPLARPSFDETEIGDLELFAPWIGIHDGGIYHIGVVKAVCPVDVWFATKILWPETPSDDLSRSFSFSIQSPVIEIGMSFLMMWASVMAGILAAGTSKFSQTVLRNSRASKVTWKYSDGNPAFVL
jgi:hypothetical protein